MARTKNLDSVATERTIFHHGPAGTFPTLKDLVPNSKSVSKPKSESVKIIYDDGVGVKRIYYVTSRGNLGYISLT